MKFVTIRTDASAKKIPLLSKKYRQPFSLIGFSTHQYHILQSFKKG